LGRSWQELLLSDKHPSLPKGIINIKNKFLANLKMKMTFMISTFRIFANGTKVVALSKLFRDSIRSKLLETRKKVVDGSDRKKPYERTAR